MSKHKEERFETKDLLACTIERVGSSRKEHWQIRQTKASLDKLLDSFSKKAMV